MSLFALFAFSLMQAPGSSPGSAAPDSMLDAQRRTAVVDSLFERLSERYVFPQKVAPLAKEVRARLSRGRYSHLRTAGAFADTLSADLRTLANDRHLAVRYSSRVLPARRLDAASSVQEKPTEAEGARLRAQAATDNYGLGRVELLEDGIGIIEVKSFGWEADAVEEAYADAMSRLARATVLVIDVRSNGGGTPNAVALLSSYLFGPQRLHLNSIHWREGRDRERVDSFWTRREVRGARFGAEKPVVVLTSSRTFSAAEEFVFNLQAHERVYVIGEVTRGGANPGQAERLDDHFYAFVPTGRAVNPVTGNNWEGTGIKPDMTVPAARALEEALHFIRTPR